MALATMGGMLAGTLLTLVLLPTLYVACFGRRNAALKVPPPVPGELCPSSMVEAR
jgi:hypothetical protein